MEGPILSLAREIEHVDGHAVAQTPEVLSVPVGVARDVREAVVRWDARVETANIATCTQAHYTHTYASEKKDFGERRAYRNSSERPVSLRGIFPP